MPSDNAPGLSRSLWPFHLKPHPHELLSSWLIRLAHAHGYKVERLCRTLLGVGAGMWNRDIDRSANEALAEAVLAVTGATRSQFDEATLLTLAGFVSESVTANGNSRWIIPLSIYHRTRKKPGLMCCAACLASDRDPYFRKTWRMACITVCTTHHLELLDACPQCRAPLMPHRTDMGYKTYAPTDRLLVLCHGCGFDLRRSPRVAAEDGLVKFTRLIERATSNGYLPYGEHHALHAVAYMDGLHLLIQAARRIVNARGDSSSQDAGTTDSAIQRVEFEKLPIAQRRLVVGELANITEHGPTRIASYLRSHGVLYSQLARPGTPTPYWLAQALLPLKRSQHPPRLSEEVAAIADAVERREVGGYSPKSARSLFNAHIDSRILPRHHQSTVSDSVYEHLLISLDHEIAGTFDGKARFALLQDKIMFSLLRLTHHTTVSLSAMELSDIPDVDIAGVEFETEPRSEHQTWERLCWHVQRVRVRQEFALRHTSVFVSPYTGLPLGSSAIQERFKSAVQRAYLTAAISGVNAFKGKSRDHPAASPSPFAQAGLR